MLTSSNPTLRAFDRIEAPRYRDLAGPSAGVEARPGVMTVQGTVIKTGVLLAICATVAVLLFGQFAAAVQGGAAGSVTPWLWGSLMGGLVLGLIISFKPTTAPYLAPLYAAVQGVLLSALSVFVTVRYLKSVDVGLIFQAVTLTFGITIAMLIAYATGIFRPGRFLRGVFIAGAAGIMLTYLIAMVAGLFGAPIGFLHNTIFGAGPIGIGFSVFCVVMATLGMAFAFSTVHRGVEAGAPRHMEWFGAFAILVELVWLYIEVLRLIAKLRSND
ncbi:MAG: Bax inhibitor-1/YccA family protein [Phycisphaerae bacterium]|nr:Bax inhibitor-1/YccA family protein [Phycisphaerae bacterium]